MNAHHGAFLLMFHVPTVVRSGSTPKIGSSASVPWFDSLFANRWLNEPRPKRRQERDRSSVFDAHQIRLKRHPCGSKVDDVNVTTRKKHYRTDATIFVNLQVAVVWLCQFTASEKGVSPHPPHGKVVVKQNRRGRRVLTDHVVHSSNTIREGDPAKCVPILFQSFSMTTRQP